MVGVNVLVIVGVIEGVTVGVNVFVGVCVGVSDIVGVIEGVTEIVGVTGILPPPITCFFPKTLPTERFPIALILLREAKLEELTKFLFLGVLPGI